MIKSKENSVDSFGRLFKCSNLRVYYMYSFFFFFFLNIRNFMMFYEYKITSYFISHIRNKKKLLRFICFQKENILLNWYLLELTTI